MTYDETEQRVAAFIAQQIRDGACPVCLAKALIGVAVDISFDGGFTEDVHATLRRCCVVLDQCQSEAAAQLH